MRKDPYTQNIRATALELLGVSQLAEHFAVPQGRCSYLLLQYWVVWPCCGHALLPVGLCWLALLHALPPGAGWEGCAGLGLFGVTFGQARNEGEKEPMWGCAVILIFSSGPFADIVMAVLGVCLAIFLSCASLVKQDVYLKHWEVSQISHSQSLNACMFFPPAGEHSLELCPNPAVSLHVSCLFAKIAHHLVLEASEQEGEQLFTWARWQGKEKWL